MLGIACFTRRRLLGLIVLLAVAQAHDALLEQTAWRRPATPRAPPPPVVTVRVASCCAALAPPADPAAIPVTLRSARTQHLRHRAPNSHPKPATALPSRSEPHHSQHLPTPITLDFFWQVGDVTLPAQLRWQHDHGRYTLSLETAPDGPPRTTSWLRSRGQLDTLGIRPERFTVRRAPASERALTFVRNDTDVTVAFSAHTYTRTAPADGQDALSWLPHWLSRLASGQAENRVDVADVDGRLQQWQFLSDPADPWHWETMALPDQTTVALWLSPEAPHWPLRMIITPPWGMPWALWRSTPQVGATE